MYSYFLFTTKIMCLSPSLRKTLHTTLTALRNDIQELIKTVTHASETAQVRYEQERDQQRILRWSEQLANKQSEGRARESDDKHYGIQVWLCVGTWLAFIAAVIYAGITYQQWRTFQESMHRQQRAYMVYADGTVKADGAIVVNFRNMGQTPAYKTRSWWTYSFMKDPTTYLNDHPGEPALLNDLFAMGELRDGLTLDVGGSGGAYKLKERDLFIRDTKTESLAQTELLRRHKGRESLFVWGVIAYSDAFQQCQLTAFIAKSAPKATSADAWILRPYYEISSDHFFCTFLEPFGPKDRALFRWDDSDILGNPPSPQE